MVFTVLHKNVEGLRHLSFHPPLCLYSPVPILVNQRNYTALIFGILFSNLHVRRMLLYLCWCPQVNVKLEVIGNDESPNHEFRQGQINSGQLVLPPSSMVEKSCRKSWYIYIYYHKARCMPVPGTGEAEQDPETVEQPAVNWAIDLFQWGEPAEQQPCMNW